MAVVTFTRLWLSSVADPSVRRDFRLASLELDADSGATVEGGYASGRKRLWRRKGSTKAATVVLRSPTAADLEFLAEWCGEPLWLRGPRGEKFAGAYPTLKTLRTPGPVGDDVSLTFAEITATQAV